MLNMPLARHLFHRVFLGRLDFERAAHSQWMLSPEEEARSPSAVYMDGQLDRVVGVTSETTREQEWRRILGGVVTHAASMAYLFRRVDLRDGHIYARRWKHSLAQRRASPFANGRPTHVDRAALCCSYIGNRYFGHWLTDDLPLSLAAAELACPIRNEVSLTPHQQEYSQLLRVSPAHIAAASIDELIVLIDHSQGSSKRRRYQELRRRLRGDVAKSGGEGVMILRGNSGVSRQLLNEDAIAEKLSSRGFVIVDPTKESARSMLERLLDARVVVGVEGSHLAHALYALRDGGAYLVIQPPYRFNNVFKDYADCLGMRYAFVVGKRAGDGFTASPDEVERTLDLLGC